MDKVSLNRPNLEKLDKAVIPEREPAKTAAVKAADVDKPTEMPDYVVSITAEKIDEKSTYTRAEVRAKAKELLASKFITEEERATLGEILSKEG